MGFLTNISISNDFWHTIAADPDKLVGAISIGMNYGTDGPLSTTFYERDEREGKDSYRYHVQRATPQGVTVHKAQHYDTPQVITNVYGSRAQAAHEMPYAIRQGWLEGNPYRREEAEKTVQLLEELAANIRKALKAA